MKQRIVNIVEI